MFSSLYGCSYLNIYLFTYVFIYIIQSRQNTKSWKENISMVGSLFSRTWYPRCLLKYRFKWDKKTKINKHIPLNRVVTWKTLFVSDIMLSHLHFTVVCDDQSTFGTDAIQLLYYLPSGYFIDIAEHRVFIRRHSASKGEIFREIA